jgi:glycosyltransferase involved in cell wall biosynthesis
MPRRVLFVTTTYPIKPGDSIPSFVADLAQALVRDAGIQVRVIAPHHSKAARRETVNGVEIERFQYAMNPESQCLAYGAGIPDNLKYFRRARWQLPGFFLAMAAAVWRNAEWADLIHAHWIEPAFLAMSANRLGRPVVVSVHSLKPRASRLQRHTLRRVDCALFNSHYTIEQAKAKGYFPCPGQVMYQGYDDQLFGLLPRGNGARQRLGIPESGTLIMALGRLIEMKGIHVLARAADRILVNRPDAHLVIAGDGPLRGEIRAVVASSASRGRIHLTGALPRHEVARLLADADIYVNSGVIDAVGRAEALGITTLEAMASGLACVGSRVGGIAETIVDQVTGLLVPPGDEAALAEGVGRLADDARLRAEMGEAGRRRAKDHFTWTVLAGEVAKVYERLEQSAPVALTSPGGRQSWATS